MAKTTLTLNSEYFTVETTRHFVADFENACETMELSDFTTLFLKYDLSFLEDYHEVFNLIAHIMSSWKNEGEETKILEISKDLAQCLFCNIGKTVTVYSWTYKHSKAKEPLNRIIYKSKVGFYLEYREERLTEFGVCNAYT